MGFQKSEDLSFSHSNAKSIGGFHTENVQETGDQEDIMEQKKETVEGILFILSGPSGVGKNEMMQRISETFPEFKKPRSKTTRPPRQSEYDSAGNLISQYDHLTKEEFEKLIENGELLEFNASQENGHYYGTGVKEVKEGLKNGDHMIKEMEVKGRQTAVEKLAKKNVYSIFLSIANPEILRHRIKRRGDNMNQAELEERVKNAFLEIDRSSSYDVIISSVEGATKPTPEQIKEQIETTFQLIKSAIEQVLSDRRKNK